MKIDARLTFSKVRFDADSDAHLVLSLTAPVMDTDKLRPKLAMILCIDTSSSMAGPKLEYAKQSAFKMIEHLKNDDVLGIVSFDSQVSVVVKPVRLEGRKDEMRKAVQNLAANGMTNFSGGMIKSIDLLKNLDLGANYIHRVIMLTDGVANVGPAKEPADILKLLNANMDHVTLSAFGYGKGTEFAPDFLAEFAKQGKGNYAHVEDPDKALKAFGTELGGLMSTYATDLLVEIKPLNGHSIESVVTDVDTDEENTGEVLVKVPDLLAEETRHIVVAVKLAKQKTHGPRAVNVFDISTKFQTFDSVGKRESRTEESKVKVQFVKDGEQDKTPDTALDDIVGLAQLVRAQLEAEEQAKKGNFVQAQAVMHNAADAFKGRGREKLAAVSARLGGQMASASLYGQNASYLRSFERGATRGVGVNSYAGGADADLSDLGVQLNTSSQNATSAAFTGGTVVTTTAGNSAVGAAPLAGASWVVPPPVPGVVAPLYIDPSAVMAPVASIDPGIVLSPLPQAPIAAPIPTNEANKGGSKPSSKKSLKQSRKSW